MKILIAFIALIVFTGCEGRNLSDLEIKGVDSANKNIDIVATNLTEMSESSQIDMKLRNALSANARILTSQAQTIGMVLPADSLTDAQRGVATVDAELLRYDPVAAADQSIAKDETQRTEIKEAQSMWSKVRGWAGWGAIGGIAASLAVAAQRLLAPQLSAFLTDPLMRQVPVIGGFMRKAEDGQATIQKYKGLVGDSLVARTALSSLQDKLDIDVQKKIAEKIKELTGRNDQTLDALFRNTADSNSTDRGAGAETSLLIKEVRDEIPTRDGLAKPA